MKSIKNPLLLSAVCILTACSDESGSTQKESMADSPAEITKPIEKEMVAEVESKIEEKTEVAANEGFDAPLKFSLTDLDGNEVKASDYRGKWLVINYWATWCAPCRDEMPELVKFQQENAEQVQVLGIAYEDTEIAKLKSFAKDFNVNYPLLTIDVYNPPDFAAEGGLGLPTTIVYNPEGMRHKKHIGPIDAAGLLALVK